MQRQVFKNGRWTYIDLGPAAAGKGKQRPLVATFIVGQDAGASNAARNGGGKRLAVKGCQ